jgi:hypothetical protein
LATRNATKAKKKEKKTRALIERTGCHAFKVEAEAREVGGREQ